MVQKISISHDHFFEQPGIGRVPVLPGLHRKSSLIQGRRWGRHLGELLSLPTVPPGWRLCRAGAPRSPQPSLQAEQGSARRVTWVVARVQEFGDAALGWGV